MSSDRIPEESGRLFSEAEDRETLDRAIEVWGPALQVQQTIEELEELRDVLEDRMNGRAGPNAVRDEIADVLIMANQLAQMYDPALVEEVLEYKMNRLDDRLDEAEEESG